MTSRPFLRPVAVALAVMLPLSAAAIEWNAYEGATRGFPVLRDQSGKKIADGDFAQWTQNGRLHVKITYTGGSRRIVEQAVFLQRPELTQEAWSLRELHDGKLQRLFEVNFAKGIATATKHNGEALEEWSDDVNVEPGRAFAGFGFSLAIRALRPRLIRGEHVKLQAVGFSPNPRVVTVELSYAGVDRVQMSGRTIRADRFIVHPKVPLIARLFVDVPDAQIWLTTPPVTFLRMEGPLAEPNDPPARIDLLPGGPSGPATPVSTTGRRD